MEEFAWESISIRSVFLPMRARPAASEIANLHPHDFAACLGTCSGQPSSPLPLWISLEGIGKVLEFSWGKDVTGMLKGSVRPALSLGTGPGYVPSDKAVVFVDNHDNQRGDNLYYAQSGYAQAEIFALLSGPSGSRVRIGVTRTSGVDLTVELVRQAREVDRPRVVELSRGAVLYLRPGPMAEKTTATASAPASTTRSGAPWMFFSVIFEGSQTTRMSG